MMNSKKNIKMNLFIESKMQFKTAFFIFTKSTKYYNAK